MDVALKIVTRLPLEALWRDTGLVSASRGKSLTSEDITNLLRSGPVQFVVANVGSKLRWIERADCYQFWKQEVRPHMAQPGEAVILDRFPGAYCYFASQWDSADSRASIVLLEQNH